ncbi:hypothetical protein K438DRAFT_1943560 [Mycena galopus ATCC 62051]|nr:hypothetical protein K438DRAFT_1943560 [Mycena galopus ATCC 62051]
MATTTNLVSSVESTTLPATPAPGSTNLQKPTTPQGMDSSFPGSFPEELAAQQQNGESTLLDTAKGYLPTQDDVQHAMTSVGQTAKTYLPQSLAAYLPSASSSSLETDLNLAPLRPPFLADLPVTDDSALRTLSTEAQAGSLRSPHVDSSTSFASTSVSTPSAQNEVPQDSPTRTPLPAFPSPAVFDDAPTATQTSINDHKSAFAPAPVPPPLALPSASAVRASGFPLPRASSPSSSRPGSADSKFVEGIPSPMPAPAAAEDASPPVPANTPAVPGSIHINPGLSSANGGPDVVAPRAPQGRAEGEDAPLPLDVFPALEWAAASESTEPAPAPRVPSAAHDDDDLGADEDSGSGAGSGSGSDAGADAAAGMKQRRKKPKLLQRLKDKLHVGHAHA